MAFNWQTFKTRTLTAIIFVLVMLGGLLINQWTFLALFSVIHFGCWREYQKLINQIDKNYTKKRAFHKYGAILVGWLFMLSFANNGNDFSKFPLNQFGGWLVLVFLLLLVIDLTFQKKRLPKNIGHSIFGLLYISLSLGLLIDLYAKKNAHITGTLMTEIHFHDLKFLLPPYFLPACIIASLWINDTMAYIVGSLIGKTQMSRISPKKTWEGTIGGVVLSMAVIFLVSFYVLQLGVLSYALIILSAIASIAGTCGDLLESKLKRMAGVKDSGRIMPGHGGFLDRFDSLLVAIPFVWLYVHFFML